MTDDSHLADRAARAQKIIAAPEHFKICEGCDSIVTRKVSTCPNCHGYRFEEDPAAVVAQATVLATRQQTSVTAADLE